MNVWLETSIVPRHEAIVASDFLILRRVSVDDVDSVGGFATGTGPGVGLEKTWGSERSGVAWTQLVVTEDIIVFLGLKFQIACRLSDSSPDDDAGVSISNDWGRSIWVGARWAH